jgi:hypothetical protein
MSEYCPLYNINVSMINRNLNSELFPYPESNNKYPLQYTIKYSKKYSEKILAASKMLIIY